MGTLRLVVESITRILAILTHPVTLVHAAVLGVGIYLLVQTRPPMITETHAMCPMDECRHVKITGPCEITTNSPQLPTWESFLSAFVLYNIAWILSTLPLIVKVTDLPHGNVKVEVHADAYNYPLKVWGVVLPWIGLWMTILALPVYSAIYSTDLGYVLSVLFLLPIFVGIVLLYAAYIWYGRPD